jgi:hypothetical protein
MSMIITHDRHRRYSDDAQREDREGEAAGDRG